VVFSGPVFHEQFSSLLEGDWDPNPNIGNGHLPQTKRQGNLLTHIIDKCEYESASGKLSITLT
jgi:hypothetical protein